MTADLGDVFARLEPLQQRAVALVYFDDRTTNEAAGLLGVDRAVLAASLSSAFRRVGRWVTAPDSHRSPAPDSHLGCSVLDCEAG